MEKRLRVIKVLLMFVATTLSGLNFVNAQTACAPGSHPVFAEPSNVKPVLLNRLGTRPQFGEIPQHTAVSAYTHLSKVYKADKRNDRKELDHYLTSLGYNGFTDPAFNASKITPEILPAGKKGWMGAYTTGHKYAWSILGKDFEAYKIISKSGECASYIMKKCGNAFYTSNCVPCTPCDPQANDKVKCPNGINGIIGLAKPMATCKTQTLNLVGKSNIKASDVVNTKKEMPLVANFNGESVCLGNYSVPVRVTYEMTANGEVNYSKPIEVCDFGAGVTANNTINMPLNLGFKLSGSDIKVGDDGKMNLTMSDASQFNTLKNAFGTCNSSTSTATSASKFAKSVKSSEATANTLVGGGNPEKCVKQTLNVSGDAVTSDEATQTSTQQVTVVGMYKYLGKLAKGESAEKYMCLGTYSIPTTTALQYNLTGKTNLDTQIEVCDNGKVKPVEGISVPVKLTSNLTKSDVVLGDYGKVYVALTKAQYKKLSKSFSRCCAGGNGTASCN